MPKRSTSAGREAWECVADLWFGDENNHRFHEACAAADVSPPQLKALLSLEHGQLLPMRALAENWRCDASWVTGIVDGLEERGYVERRPHETDRRVKVVTITALGEKAKGRAMERLYEPPASLLNALTQNEQRTLRDLLRKVRDSNSRQ
jgi:DNA-binding MarR family transcriptional regulator